MTRLFVLSAFVLFGFACTPSENEFLNPNRKTGGDCKNGDQLGIVCGDECCPGATMHCEARTCVPDAFQDPFALGKRSADAGTGAR